VRSPFPLARPWAGQRCAGWCRPPATLRCARGRRCLSPRGHSPAGPGCWAGGCGPVDLRPTGASHPWPSASRSGPAARVPFLVRPLRGRPRAGTAGAVCPFGSRAAAVLPCVPACRPSRADGGDTGFESRSRWYLLIYSMETVFLRIGRSRRARARLGNLSYAPGRDVGERRDRPAWRAEPSAAGLSPAGNGKAYGLWRYRWCWCLLDLVCSPRFVPSDPRDARGKELD
jgi:hypothetical protein